MLKCKEPTPENDWAILSLDSEQDENANTYVWALYGLHPSGHEISKIFTSRSAAKRYLFDRKWHHTILTGVNLAFDLNTLRYKGGYNWEEITNMGHLITASPSVKEMKKQKFRDRSEYLRIMDLSNFILGTSLKGMCEMFGIEGHIDKHILGKDGDIKEMSEACLSHAKTAVLVMAELQKQLHAIGVHIQVTGASTAMDTYRRYYLPEWAQIYDFKNDNSRAVREYARNNATAEDAEQDLLYYVRQIGKNAYVGGRCENFGIGLYEHQDYLDINSSYPYQMRERAYPNINTYARRQGDAKALMAYIKDYEGEALVKVKCPNIGYPFLHYKREDGKLLFPGGILEAWYTFPEIKKAVSIGYKILEVKEIALFERMPSPFVAYVDEMMKLKVKPDTKQAAKLLMNGLSGKFGQLKPKGEAWREATEEEIQNNDERIHVLDIGVESQGWIYDPEDDEPEGFAYTSYPLLVAYITAWGRIQEYEAMEAIGFEHVHYMDTDSIIGDREFIQKAIKEGKIPLDKKKLGAFDLEHEDVTVEIKGLKNYRIYENNEYKYKMKGIPVKYAPEMWRSGEAHMLVAVKKRQALRSKMRVNSFIPMVKTERVERDNKRIFEPETIYNKKQFSSIPYIVMD